MGFGIFNTEDDYSVRQRWGNVVVLLGLGLGLGLGNVGGVTWWSFCSSKSKTSLSLSLSLPLSPEDSKDGLINKERLHRVGV